MTQDEIIEMAREAGLPITYVGDSIGLRYTAIAHFAKLVAAKEREACAKMFDGAVWAYDYREIAAAIRARGQA